MEFTGPLVFLRNNPLYEVNVTDYSIDVEYYKYIRNFYFYEYKEKVMLCLLAYVMNSKQSYPIDCMKIDCLFKVNMKNTTERSLTIDDEKDKVFTAHTYLRELEEGDSSYTLTKEEYEQLKDPLRVDNIQFALYQKV